MADLGDINQAKQTQIYLEALKTVGKENPHLSNVLELVGQGLALQINQQSMQSVDKRRDKDPTEGITDKEIQVKIKNYERVIKEIKKQLACYKTEMENIKKTESYITMENY